MFGLVDEVAVEGEEDFGVFAGDFALLVGGGANLVHVFVVLGAAEVGEAPAIGIPVDLAVGRIAHCAELAVEARREPCGDFVVERVDGWFLFGCCGGGFAIG